MKKILTVLIPVYNTEKYIKRCLDSLLLKETNSDVELLIVSDGSKDNSVNIIKEYVKVYPGTIRLIEKENAGHGSTINVGIKEAKGKYFKVIDSDDWVNSIDFITFVSRLKKETADLVVTNYTQEHIYKGETIYNEYSGLTENKLYDFDKIDLNILKGEYFVMATSTYKTSILKSSNLHLMEKTFYVDMQYNVVPITEVNTFTYYNLDIYRYFIGRLDQSVNTSSFVRNKLHHEKVLKFLIEFYEDNKRKLSVNKKRYIKMIINYTLYTHYNIFCSYDTSKKEATKQIKEFDKYLKEKSIKLYLESDKMAYTKMHRKTNFYFVKHSPRLYTKLLSFSSKIKRRLNKWKEY